MNVITTNYINKRWVMGNLRDNMCMRTSNNIKYNNTYRINKSKNLYIFCLNANIKIIFNSATKNIYLRINTSLIHKCSGGLVSQDKLVKLP